MATEPTPDSGLMFGQGNRRERRPVLLTARQVAEQLGVSSETVLRWTRSGALPGFRLPGGALRYRDVDLENWLEGRGTITATRLKSSETRGPPVEIAGVPSRKQRGGDRNASDSARPGLQAQLW